MNILLASSVNPKRLGLTIKGILVGVVAIAAIFGMDVVEKDIDILVESILAVITGIITVASSIMIAWGLIRKFLVALGVIKKKEEE